VAFVHAVAQHWVSLSFDHLAVECKCKPTGSIKPLVVRWPKASAKRDTGNSKFTALVVMVDSPGFDAAGCCIMV
jgi:hypothetical protein